MTTKQQSAVVEAMQAELAKLQARIAALTSESIGVSEAAVKRFTQQHWHALRMAMVVGGADKPQLAKDRKGYALVKGVDVKWYMACKGFEATLRSRAQNGLPVELSSTPNDKGRSQVLYAQEILQALVDAKFIDANSPLLVGNEPKARKSRKS